MAFPLEPPIEPMLAKPLPLAGGEPAWPDPSATPGGLAYEPKWDGFRCLVFRDGTEVAIQGRMRAADAAATGKWDLTYAFPEMVARIQAMSQERFVIDGELISIRDGRLDFDSLGMRLRPRSEEGGWKIKELSQDLPTELVAFDALAVGATDLRKAPFRERREALVGLLDSSPPGVHLTPQTTDPDLAKQWFWALPGAGLDGVMVKPLGDPYAPGKRTMFKAKHRHTVDVVAAGWRPYARPGMHGQPVVGSILLGLHDANGTLQLVGAASAFTAMRRAELAELFQTMAAPEDHPWIDSSGRAPGQVSRWSGGRDAHWYPLRPELVCEVTYDQVTNGRFRHVAGFVRWRPDRDAASATMDQLFVPEPMDLAEFLATSGAS